MLAATYGILTTTDRGGHWYHTCEAEFAGDPQYSGDPLLEIVAGGAALVDVQSFVARSGDACAWAPTLGSAGTTGRTIVDLAVDTKTRTTVVAVETRLVDGAWTIGLQRSDDAGITWRPVGGALPATEVFSIDLDPADATHVYATGLSSTRDGIFLTSLDGGATWQTSPIPNTGEGAFPYIAAVDPSHPGTIYVRTDSWILPDGAPEEVANDALLVSSDGGAGWTTLLQEPAKLLGFALSPDGGMLLAGYGDPVEPDYFVDPTVTGIYAASTFNPQFAMAFPDAVTCLTWTARGIYACVEEQASGTVKELAFFDGEAALDGGSPQTLMRLSDILGPPPCCPATDAVCDWLEVCPTLGPGACGDGGLPSVSCSSSSRSPVATVDGSVGGSVGPSGVDAAAPAEAAAAQDVATAARGAGCACRAAPWRADPRATLVTAAAAGLLARTRRRRWNA
jgi:hypothetical protein